MTPTEALPLLVVTLLLISVGGGDIQQLDVTFDGDHAITEIDDALVVAGGTSALASATSVRGNVYVIGGETRIAGALQGNVTVLAGNLSVADGAAISGRLQRIAGTVRIAETASVGEYVRFEPPAPGPSPARQLGFLVMQFLLLGAAGWWLTTRRPGLLDNVGQAIGEHALVSGVVGALGGVSLLVLFVYMAFTILLLPVAILGLAGEFLVVLYGQVALGHALGQRLPIEQAARATVLGVGLVLLALDVLGMVPLVGPVVQLGLLVVGFGAVLLTFFGLQPFVPATIPEGSP